VAAQDQAVCTTTLREKILKKKLKAVVNYVKNTKKLLTT
jgi:hypothetical protein